MNHIYKYKFLDLGLLSNTIRGNKLFIGVDFTCYIKYIITCKNYSKMLIFEQHWLSMAISITCIIMNNGCYPGLA